MNKLYNLKDANLDRLLNEVFFNLWLSDIKDPIVNVTFALADTEQAIAHGLTKAPRYWIVLDKDRSGDIYKSKAPDNTNIYLKCTTASTQAVILIVR